LGQNSTVLPPIEQLQEIDFPKIEKTIAAAFANHHETQHGLIIDVTDTYFEVVY
jgi:hypothetical protein